MAHDYSGNNISDESVAGADMAGAKFVGTEANNTIFGECPDEKEPSGLCKTLKRVADILWFPGFLLTKFGFSVFNEKSTRMDFGLSDFSNAELTGAKFHCADLHAAIFENADANSAMFDRADLRGANFSSAELVSAVFKNCSVERADFTRADIRNVEGLKFDETTISGAVLETNARDPWSTLTRTYTGQKFALYLLLTILFVIGISSSGILSSRILFQSGIGLPLGEDVCDKLECETVNVVLLISGWHFADFWGRSFLLLATAYNALRLLMTLRVSALRALSAATGQTPAWLRWRTSAHDSFSRRLSNFWASYGPLYVAHMFVFLFGIVVLGNSIMSGTDLIARSVDIPVRTETPSD